jgi:hypothetical protein
MAQTDWLTAMHLIRNWPPKGTKRHEELFVFLRDFLWQFNPAIQSETNLHLRKSAPSADFLADG